ncbi:hypothetical protein QO179_01935 [Bacillus stercoris]|nr:hypothetical protein [Bacillus stercoris]
MTFFSKEELQRSGISKEIAENADYVPAKSFIEGKDRFDPSFFQISLKMLNLWTLSFGCC